jgi:hypothetical protein
MTGHPPSVSLAVSNNFHVFRYSQHPEDFLNPVPIERAINRAGLILFRHYSWSIRCSEYFSTEILTNDSFRRQIRSRFLCSSVSGAGD